MKHFVPLLILGLLLIILTPFLFVYFNWGFINYKDSGEIGDTIGGITTPFISLFGAILVYISFREQVKANEKIQDQIRQSHDERNFEFIVSELNLYFQQKRRIMVTYGRDVLKVMKRVENNCEAYGNNYRFKANTTYNIVKLNLENAKADFLPYHLELEELNDLINELFQIDLQDEYRIIVYRKFYNKTKFIYDDFFIKLKIDISNSIVCLNGVHDDFLGDFIKTYLSQLQELIIELENGVMIIHKKLGKPWMGN